MEEIDKSDTKRGKYDSLDSSMDFYACNYDNIE
jgi:hypothetical protein